MSIKTVITTLSADVATNGTFTVTYPTGYSKGSFTMGSKHTMVALQNTYRAPKDMTLSFGATSVTVTYKGSTTLPANTTVYFGLDIPGPDSFLDVDSPNDAKLQVRPAKARLLNLGSPLTASTTAFLNAATGATFAPNANTITYTYPLLSSASFVGANLTGIQDVPRNVVMTVTHASSIVASSAVVTALDIDGFEFKETLSVTATGTSKTATGKRAAAKITSIAITSASDATANSFSFGFGTVLGLPVFVPSSQFIQAELLNDTVLPSYGSDKVLLPYFINQTDLLAPTVQTVVTPVAGTITAHKTVVQVAVTTGGTLALKINNSAVTGGTATVANAATVRTVNNGTAITAANTLAAGDVITITPASFATAGAINGVVEIAPSKTTRGTFTGAVFTTSGSTTSGDTRGTYDPETAPDGTNSYALLVILPDAQSNGTQQFDG